MLHRAHVNVSGHAFAQWPETTVFYECPMGANPSARLRTLLEHAWGVPREAIDSYNVQDEPEMRRNWACAESQPGRPPVSPECDTTLLQIGDGPSGRLFCDPQRTVMIVGPLWAARLARARADADAVRKLQAAHAIERLAPTLHAALEVV